MGNLSMPKHSSELIDSQAVLKIMYEKQDWISNDELTEKLKQIISPDQYRSSYTKKAQIPLYFGFVEGKDNSRSPEKRITQLGIRHYLSIVEDNTVELYQTIVESIEMMKFGRDNLGSPSSDSDIDPPTLFIRAILDLEKLSYKEFEYMLWKMNDKGASYSDTIKEILTTRDTEFEFPDEAKETRYSDAKPILYLEKLGFLEVESSQNRTKFIKISDDVLSRYKNRLRNLKVYNIDKSSLIVEDNQLYSIISRKKGGENILLYGVPGSGKSHTIKEKYTSIAKFQERVVFHPEYGYSDFVGQILPRLYLDSVSNTEKVSYGFTPGPFARMLKKAYSDPNNMYYLIIEEINRGNAPAIFGEVFQLLDRDNDGTSTYAISNYDISKYVFNTESEEIKIPSNMTLLATMNTSDQNIFTLDTAFQRRWKMRLLENDIPNSKNAHVKILDSDISWSTFCLKINEHILKNSISNSSTEDKRLGAYFVTKNELMYDEKCTSANAEERLAAIDKNKLFADKVVKYLWDDVFKYNREALFKEEYNSLEDVLKEFNNQIGNNRFKIFSISF